MTIGPRGTASAAVLSGLLLATGCARGSAKPATPSTTHEALAAFRADLARQLAALPGEVGGSATERTLLGQLATEGRTRLRRARERLTPIAPERLATFLAPLAASDDAAEQHAWRSTFQGRGYSIASTKLEAPGGTVWVEVIDPAGSPELLAAFEVERAVAAVDGSRFRALEVARFPAVQTSVADGVNRPGQVARTLEVLVADRLLVAARGTAGVEPAALATSVSRIDLEALATAVARPAGAPGTAPTTSSPERSDDG